MSEGYHPVAEKLLIQFQPLWYRIAFQYVRNHQDAQDIVQEAFRKFLTVEREWDSVEDAKRYFGAILVNTSVDFYKTTKKRREEFLEERQGVREAETDWRQSPGKDHQEQEEAILELSLETIAQLPADQRIAIERLLLAENPCSLTDLSRELAIPISTLKSRVVLGIEKVKKMLRKKRLL